jgi:hypothetical protein
MINVKLTPYSARHVPMIRNSPDAKIRRGTEQSRGFGEEMRVVADSDLVPGEELSEKETAPGNRSTQELFSSQWRIGDLNP